MIRLSLILAGAATLSATATSASETVTYVYDAQGRLVSAATSGTVNNGIATNYAHDNADNRSNVTVTGAPN